MWDGGVTSSLVTPEPQRWAFERLFVMAQS
jgi:hypothetical protein